MKKVLSFLSFIGTASLFSLIRVPSLLAHYVAYTYDQGRDFIAGAQIITLHKIPFIGPTTGINGLFHGSWWYYLLTIPYVLFQGPPIGFYWFNFFIQLSLLIVLMLFLKREFGLMVSLMFGLLISLSPYFTFMSLFVGNNSMVLPSLLIFLISNYFIFKENKVSPLLLCITGLSLSFVGEFELSFGIFLIPLYFVSVLIFQKLKTTLLHKQGLFFLLGLFMGFAPRILFEIKNAFPQTKILISFLLHPKLYNNPSPYLNRVNERWILFQSYFFELFSEKYFGYVFLIFIIGITAITVISVIQKKSKIQPVFYFYSFLLIGLFFLSTLYKDFFWKNYYEGIHYIYLFIVISLIGQSVHKKFIRVKQTILYIILLGFFVMAAITLSKSQKPPFDGLQVQETVVSYILTHQKQSEDYCLRIYTPSVIPHTYTYLFMVNKMKPSNEWVKGTCWFIVESDSYVKRRDDWLSVHTPKDRHSVVVKKIKDIEIRFYKVQPQ